MGTGSDDARHLIVHADANTLESLRRGNAVKAARLEQAMWAQLVAFVVLTAGLVLVLLGG